MNTTASTDRMPRRPNVQTLDSGGVRIAYEDWPGEKGPLVCLSSITGHKGSFASFAQALSPEFRLIALDARGRGDSDKPADGYGFAYHARDIIAVADTLGFDSFVLVGHSFGATASVYTATVRPDRVRALVLMDGGADPSRENLEAMFPTVRRLAKKFTSMEEYVAAQRKAAYHRPWSSALEKYVCEDVFVADGIVQFKSSAKAVERDLEMHFWENVWFHLSDIRCPAIFLQPTEGLLGETGHVYRKEEAERLVALIPDCRFVRVPGGNHYTMLIQDDPPVVNPAREFLKQVLVPASAGSRR